MLCDVLLLISLWWDHVIEMPEERRIKVLRRGIWNGLKLLIPFGGQARPSSKSGASIP